MLPMAYPFVVGLMHTYVLNIHLNTLKCLQFNNLIQVKPFVFKVFRKSGFVLRVKIAQSLQFITTKYNFILNY